MKENKVLFNIIIIIFLHIRAVEKKQEVKGNSRNSSKDVVKAERKEKEVMRPEHLKQSRYSGGRDRASLYPCPRPT